MLTYSTGGEDGPTVLGQQVRSNRSNRGGGGGGGEGRRLGRRRINIQWSFRTYAFDCILCFQVQMSKTHRKNRVLSWPINRPQGGAQAPARALTQSAKRGRTTPSNIYINMIVDIFSHRRESMTHVRA